MYKLILNGNVITTLDSPKQHGEIIEHNGNKLFCCYTKGKSIFC